MSSPSTSIPDWDTSWDDQVGYQRLGHVLATTGSSRAIPTLQPFVPETIRTPGYPLFVAGVYRIAGESHAAVAAAQAVLFALLTLVVFALGPPASPASASRWPRRVFTALFPPIPYYGALVLTEVLVHVSRDARHVDRAARRPGSPHQPVPADGRPVRPRHADPADLRAVPGRARRRASRSPRSGARMASRTALERGRSRPSPSRSARGWPTTPIYVHRLTISPAGGIGRATWEASWQGTWPGRVQADLTRLVDAHVDDDDATLDAQVVQLRGRQRHAGRADAAPTCTSGATSAASGTRRPIRASVRSRASPPTMSTGASAWTTSSGIASVTCCDASPSAPSCCGRRRFPSATARSTASPD